MKNQIVFIHWGKQIYFDIVLKQCLIYNKKNEIVVIGEGYNKSIKGVNFENYLEYYDKNFKEKYVHLSPNPYEYELRCFERWFILKNYMNKNNLEYTFACDSDLMIYDDLYKYLDIYKNYLACYCTCEYQKNYRWSSGAHISFWAIEGINRFCDFINTYYSTDKINKLYEKQNYHKKNNISGGVCDMTLLYLFYEENKDKILNLLEVKEGIAYDDNINISENYYKDEYEYNNKIGRKDIKFIEKRPYCLNLRLNKNIRFIVLHFQGRAKDYILNYALFSFLIKIVFLIKYFIKDFLNFINRVIRKINKITGRKK